MYSLVVEKNVPLWKINLDREIESLGEVLSDSKFLKLKEDKAVTSLYNYVTKTNEIIKAKYKYKIKKFMSFK